MKKMMSMLLASVMVAGTFATTAFAYTGDDVQWRRLLVKARHILDTRGQGQ